MLSNFFGLEETTLLRRPHTTDSDTTFKQIHTYVYRNDSGTIDFRSDFRPLLSSHGSHLVGPYVARISNQRIMTTDNLYTTSLVHRSIARAALHLGIEGMETKALEALGGVLVDYLERVSCADCNFNELRLVDVLIY